MVGNNPDSDYYICTVLYAFKETLSSSWGSDSWYSSHTFRFCSHYLSSCFHHRSLWNIGRGSADDLKIWKRWHHYLWFGDLVLCCCDFFHCWIVLISLNFAALISSSVVFQCDNHLEISLYQGQISWMHPFDKAAWKFPSSITQSLRILLLVSINFLIIVNLYLIFWFARYSQSLSYSLRPQSPSYSLHYQIFPSYSATEAVS